MVILEKDADVLVQPGPVIWSFYLVSPEARQYVLDNHAELPEEFRERLEESVNDLTEGVLMGMPYSKGEGFANELTLAGLQVFLVEEQIDPPPSDPRMN